MGKQSGRIVPLSFARRLVCDYVGTSPSNFLIPMERRISLRELASFREQLSPRPGWCALFVKAFALVSTRWSFLRQTYLSFPWARLYESADPVGTVIIEREHQGENLILPAVLRNPEKRSLLEIENWLRRCKECPLEEVSSYRKVFRIGQLPFLLRRFLMWLVRECWGSEKIKLLGTYGISVTAGMGAGQLLVITPCSIGLHYGVLEPDGTLPLRLTFDHRVMDGANVARVMVDLEKTLNNEIRTELHELLKTQSQRACA